MDAPRINNLLVVIHIDNDFLQALYSLAFQKQSVNEYLTVIFSGVGSKLKWGEGARLIRNLVAKKVPPPSPEVPTPLTF